MGSGVVVAIVLDHTSRSSSFSVAGIWRPCWLDQKQVRLFLCDRTMLYALGHHEQFARTKGDVSVSHPDCDPTLKHEEEIISVVMFVPTNSPLTLTTMRSCLLNWPTVLGCQCSAKVASFSARLMAFTFDGSDRRIVFPMPNVRREAGPTVDEAHRWVSPRRRG